MSSIRLKPDRRVPTESFHRPWGCPLTKNRTPWCFALCTPQNGEGRCGRIAPHALIGRTDGAISRYKARQAEEAVVQ